MERARKTAQENVMVRYVSMKTSQDMRNTRLAKSAESAQICSF